MKYNNLNQTIPQDQRKDINEKILYCIDNNLCSKFGLTNEVIFNSYTGIGGLHNLEFSKFDSFHSYTKAKQEVENGQFFSGFKESQYLIDLLHISEDETILDLTCGSGSLFNFLPNEYNIYGNELDIKAYKVAKHLYPLANITHGDMREYNPHILFDTIIGNPPFNLRLRYKSNEMYSQMIYVQKSYELLKNGGLLALIVPKSFLEDEFANKSDIEYMNNNFNFIGQIQLDRNAFKYLGVDNFETKIILFNKKSEFIPSKPYVNEFIEGDSNYIFNHYIKPIRELQSKFKSSIKLENLRQYTDEDKLFNEKVTKLLFDIKRTKSVKHKYTECYNYFQQYYNQICPVSLKREDWEKIKVTKEKVINRLKWVLSIQHTKEQDKIELIKTNYHIKLKGYSENTRKYVFSKQNNRIRINDLVLNGYSFEDNKYKKLIDKKKREFEDQSIKFDDMKLDEGIDKWLKEKYLYDYIKDEEIRLTDKQRFDINKILQKKYGYNQWSTGSGKSLSSLFYALYRLEFNHIKNIIVVAPAIAIKNTYVDMLETYKINYRIINSIEDINNIQDGEFLLFTFNMLIKLQRQVKKFIKINNKIFALMVDEADGISNTMSKRCKASLNCFRRLPYKLLMSGTSTRNSINEIYTQLELLYNNSINMISTNEYIYKIDDETKELKKTNNDIYMRPFPPYRKGYEYFNNSFIPKKITVFGMAKFNQDILNKDDLKQLIDKTIITRTLKDITGRDLTEPHQITCKFNDAEYSLYKTILEEFYSMSAEYQIHTGNSRKDSMFRILAQLNTLLKSCSTPHAFKEYNGNTISSKFLKVFELIDSFNERVVIGCTRVKTVDLYYSELLKRYPNRKIFRITGKDTTLKQRKDLVKQMEENHNCIVIATQQSLSCSMNIGFVDKVIITEMLWNESSMQQFKARFSRMNSDNMTAIYNVFYEKSIEVNLLKLNMAKEKLCMFMKNEDIDEEELYEQFGIDSWMLNSLMVKERNEDGSINITWGEQEINQIIKGDELMKGEKNVFNDRTSEIGINKYGSKMTIAEYRGCNDIIVEFENGYKTKTQHSHFQEGAVTSSINRTVFGVGYLGNGKYNTSYNNKPTKEYTVWKSMLQRCYDEKYKLKMPTYKNVNCCDEWLCFQNFAKWYNKNFYQVDNEVMALDKDILHKGNKIYSPENCIFVPQRINSIIIKSDARRGNLPIGVNCIRTKYVSKCNIYENGRSKLKDLGRYDTPKEAFHIYKSFKENLIKQVANEYKDKIPLRLYKAMYSWIVEITD